MGRRRQKIDKTYGAVHSRVQQLELNCLYAVPVTFTVTDFINATIPLAHQEKLRAVRELAKPGWDKSASLGLTVDGITLTYMLSFEDSDMFPPADLMSLAPHGPIYEYSQKITEITKEFKRVYRLISWIGETNCSPATVKYYWPTIVPMLGPDHPIHEASDFSHRAPEDIYKKVNDFREATTTIVGAMLMPKHTTPVNSVLNLHNGSQRISL